MVKLKKIKRTKEEQVKLMEKGMMALDKKLTGEAYMEVKKEIIKMGMMSEFMEQSKIKDKREVPNYIG